MLAAAKSVHYTHFEGSDELLKNWIARISIRWCSGRTRHRTSRTCCKRFVWRFYNLRLPGYWRAHYNGRFVFGRAGVGIGPDPCRRHAHHAENVRPEPENVSRLRGSHTHRTPDVPRLSAKCS